LERTEVWDRYRAGTPSGDGRALAEALLADPGAQDWRLVDAAMERLRCGECGAELGAGPRGCGRCDAADGYRFAAREIDRPGVPPGNEHAIRVSSTVLRAPHRYQAYIVRGNQLILPLLMAGQMPRREQKARLDRIVEGPLAGESRLEEATTFDELLALADELAREAARGRGSLANEWNERSELGNDPERG
jgi:hypothetical protein